MRWKYGRDLRLGAALAALFAERSPAPAGSDLVVPVPLHGRRLRRRGFDQAAMLAAAFARWHGAELEHALFRTSFAASQTALGRGARLENVRGRFALRRRKSIAAGRSIVLVDDILTSGATADECAVALLTAGAAHVEVRTLARAAGARSLFP